MTLPHQGHHLPWDALASHLTYVGGFSARLSHESFLHLQAGPRRHIHERSERRVVARRAAKDARHFYRVLAARIGEFAETEGRKIGREAAGAEGGEEEVLFEWQWDLRPEFKKVSLLYGSHDWVAGERFPYPLTTAVEICPGNLRSFWRKEGRCMFRADIIKHLFNLDTRESRVGLHRLARGGEFRILSNNFVHHGHHFGFSRVAEHALMLYTVLNILIVKGLHCKGRDILNALPGYERMKKYLTDIYDGCEQNVCDRLFFAKWTADTDGLPVLEEHLKLLFRRLYTYHWLVTTAGGSVDWLEFMDRSCNIFGGREFQREILPLLEIGVRRVLEV